jgi:hypothetical protein
MATDKEQRRAYSREYTKRYIANLRAAWIAEQGDKCNYCATTQGPFDIDHINRALKTHKVTRLWFMNKATRDAELAKCQVLCKPCHKQKTRYERMIHNPEHGTSAMYQQRKCRCAECKAWKAEQGRQYRAALKARQLING